MNCDNISPTESLRSTAIRFRTASLGFQQLSLTLLKSIDGQRCFYSIICTLIPCENPQEDICIVHDITGDEQKASEIFTLLADGAVSPCTMEDIISDLL
jgi:hypothetical protein